MVVEHNQFGSGNLVPAARIAGPVHAVCTACMSVYADYLSWANDQDRAIPGGRVCTSVAEAASVVVLSCQVTSDAVLNDLRTMERLRAEYPDKQIYVGGCLARRFDIELPDGVLRAGSLRADGTYIARKDLVTFAPPFWVPDFDENDPEHADGHLFRDMYPLRLSVGCGGRCTYCSIRITRGRPYSVHPRALEAEFALAVSNDEDILLVADAPSAADIHRAFGLALWHHHPVSIRNVEPPVAAECKALLVALGQAGLLRIFHTPVQHTDLETIREMGRDAGAADDAFDLCRRLRDHGVYTATNVITRYRDRPGPNLPLLREAFDYISWNAYWDGRWDRAAAENRFAELFEGVGPRVPAAADPVAPADVCDFCGDSSFVIMDDGSVKHCTTCGNRWATTEPARGEDPRPR